MILTMSVETSRTADAAERRSPARYISGHAVLAMAICLELFVSSVAPAAQAPAKPAAPPAPAAGSENTAKENAVAPEGYRIGFGDVLEINVWKEQEASVQNVTVRPDGKVSLPLVKELYVLGLTPTELEKILSAKLAQFINGPDVTVVVKQINSKKVYLVGAVSKVIPLLASMTVLQVLSEAGGLTEFAKKKKIYVLRTENGKKLKLPFNYDAVIKGEHIEQNIPVLPDDTIVIPQ